MCGAQPSSSSIPAGALHPALAAVPRQAPHLPIGELLYFPRNRESWMIENLVQDAAAEDFSSIHVLEEASSSPMRTALRSCSGGSRV